MTRLESAKARLSAAIHALEGSVDERLAQARESAAARAEVELLKAERERLHARIAALEDESRAMSGLTAELEQRLDGAITEIRGRLKAAS